MSECIEFIQRMGDKFKNRPYVLGTALHILHLYIKKHAFSEFDRFMVTTICLILACKIENAVNERQERLIEYYFNNRKGSDEQFRTF
jgi:hypothetical protein